jgi:hypothetical protein
MIVGPINAYSPEEAASCPLRARDDPHEAKFAAGEAPVSPMSFPKSLDPSLCMFMTRPLGRA